MFLTEKKSLTNPLSGTSLPAVPPCLNNMSEDNYSNLNLVTVIGRICFDRSLRSVLHLHAA